MGSDHYHAQQAVDLVENFFVERPGSSYRNGTKVTSSDLNMRKEFLNDAQRSLKQATKDYNRIQAKYDKEMQMYREYHGRDPTNIELVQARLRHNGAEAMDELDERTRALADFYEARLPTEEEDDNGEDDDDDDDNDDISDLLPDRPIRPGSRSLGLREGFPSSPIDKPEGSSQVLGPSSATGPPSAEPSQTERPPHLRRRDLQPFRA